jgi:hypothetical protein
MEVGYVEGITSLLITLLIKRKESTNPFTFLHTCSLFSLFTHRANKLVEAKRQHDEAANPKKESHGGGHH